MRVGLSPALKISRTARLRPGVFSHDLGGARRTHRASWALRTDSECFHEFYLHLLGHTTVLTLATNVRSTIWRCGASDTCPGADLCWPRARTAAGRPALQTSPLADCESVLLLAGLHCRHHHWQACTADITTATTHCRLS